jgi:hypothetical protein
VLIGGCPECLERVDEMSGRIVLLFFDSHNVGLCGLGQRLTRSRWENTVFKGGIFPSITVAFGWESLESGEHAPEHSDLAGRDKPKRINQGRDVIRRNTKAGLSKTRAFPSATGHGGRALGTREREASGTNRR